VLKIDQSFVQALDTEASMQGITRGISSLAHQLDLDVIAEGIETKRQLAFIQELSCCYGQGYLFAHPVGIEDAEQFLRQPEALKNMLEPD
jgi:EAL domain-containing protein (putative c-di-GMP-specific phosphodiesterase class I)